MSNGGSLGDSFDYSKINIDLIKDKINELDKVIISFDSSIPKIGSDPSFNKLADAGLDNGFIKNYDENIQKLIAALKGSKDTIYNVIYNMEEIDASVKKDIAGLRQLRPKRDGGTKDPSKDPYMQSDDSQPSSETKPDNSVDQIGQYSNMSMSDLSAVANALNNQASANNMTLDEFLNDINSSEAVCNVILNIPNIPDDLKELVETGDTNASRIVLQGIFNGEYPEVLGINADTKDIIMQYLEKVAKDNNITLDELVNNEQYSLLLKQSLEKFNGVSDYISNINNETINKDLLDIYDGNLVSNIPKETLSILNSYIDRIASSNNMEVSELLLSGRDLKGELNNLGKSALLMRTTSNYKNNSVTNVIKNIFKGGNANLKDGITSVSEKPPVTMNTDNLADNIGSVSEKPPVTMNTDNLADNIGSVSEKPPVTMNTDNLADNIGSVLEKPPVTMNTDNLADNIGSVSEKPPVTMNSDNLADNIGSVSEKPPVTMN